MTPEEMYFGLKRFLTIPNPTTEFTKDQAIELLLDYSEMPLVGATCVCTRLENEGVEMVPATDPRVSEDQRTRATLILTIMFHILRNWRDDSLRRIVRATPLDIAMALGRPES